MLRKRKDLLTTKILDSIPKNIKPVEYLIRMLGISKESAYRRLRGDIPFTFEEMSKLSLDLNFSMDELTAKPSESRILINMQNTSDSNPSTAFLKRLEHYCEFLLRLENYPSVETVLTLNRIPLIASVYSENLFKFLYFKCLHQNSKSYLKLNYSELSLPDKIEDLRKKIKLSLANSKNNITLIIDPNFFFSMANEIQYYHKRKLINDNDFEILKNDILAFVDLLGNSAQTGIFGQNTKMNIYLSFMNIGVNTAHFKYNNSETSFIYAFLIGPISIAEPAICGKHKKWTDSVKKYSTLITKSNEMLQLEYFDKQRELIKSLNNHFVSLY